jgi:hypothetical protein
MAAVAPARALVLGAMVASDRGVTGDGVAASSCPLASGDPAAVATQFAVGAGAGADDEVPAVLAWYDAVVGANVQYDESGSGHASHVPGRPNTACGCAIAGGAG